MHIESEIPDLQKYAESIPEGDRKQQHSSVSLKFDFLDDSQFFMHFRNKNAKAGKTEREFLSVCQAQDCGPVSHFHMHIGSEISNLHKYSESIPEGDGNQRHASPSVKFDFLDDRKFFVPFQNRNAKAGKTEIESFFPYVNWGSQGCGPVSHR
ncbi:hypothetical protein CDAR_384311 [Caerostris darwini]|uniref:Uncharacterized protein n=1 Tax=Caerostris darwini TaxID=1538125 RepID=A0AAV4R1P6_9ARAC|nr:hypothetical protein CDAR_384311 [Caerostris darwini]